LALALRLAGILAKKIGVATEVVDGREHERVNPVLDRGNAPAGTVAIR
jgi:hypothetical protein